MQPIITKIDLRSYRSRLDRQMNVLHLSKIFSEEEKENVKKCYTDLIAICDERIAAEQEAERKQLTIFDIK